MWSKRGIDKLVELADEYVFSSLALLAEYHGKTIISTCVICLCLFIARSPDDKIRLPAEVQDTVGNIPIIEHFDDGTIEEFQPPHPEYNYKSYYGQQAASTTSGSFIAVTMDTIWIGNGIGWMAY